MALAGEAARTVTARLRRFLTFIFGGEKRYLERVKKLTREKINKKASLKWFGSGVDCEHEHKHFGSSSTIGCGESASDGNADG